MAIDSKKEKQIGLGTQWPYPPLEQGECIISSQMSRELQVTTGDIIYLSSDVNYILLALVKIYN